MPVMLLGACTNAPGAVAGAVVDEVAFGGAVVVDGLALDVAAVGLVDTAVASKAGQPYRDANAVARSPPARCQPTTASTRLFVNASPYSTGESSGDTVASIPTLRN